MIMKFGTMPLPSILASLLTTSPIAAQPLKARQSTACGILNAVDVQVTSAITDGGATLGAEGLVVLEDRETDIADVEELLDC